MHIDVSVYPILEIPIMAFPLHTCSTTAGFPAVVNSFAMLKNFKQIPDAK